MADFAQRRRMMVDTQIRPSDVTSYPIIEAMLTVPREMFVPINAREVAYAGEHIYLEDNRVILDSRTLAKMLEGINFVGDELVLDVGGYLGYSSAIAARLSQVVVLLEEIEECVAEAPILLSEVAADNVVVHEGILSQGADSLGPYDVIIIQGGVGEMPEGLISQLKDGGQIAALFMEGALGSVRVGHKVADEISWRFSFNACAPILSGFEQKRVFSL
ncbi:MAG: protein-L-isoaspartate O-methyltransferase [Aestuariivita sp.]|nr:protein-L-isoaspartate O-methyltransferase [Aestuariivita sp.]